MKNSNLPMSREGIPQMDETSLLAEIKTSILNMQQQMQDTYSNLSKTDVVGVSPDGTIKIIMTATYTLKDIEINPSALAGANGKFSLAEFKERLVAAWKDLGEKIQKTTQNKTLELLQTMNIPDDIKNISLEDQGK